MASETAPLIFEKVLGTLRPVNGPAKEAMAAINGKCVVKLTRMTRNQRRRGFYWTFLDVVAEVLRDTTGTPWDAETLHDDLRERLGLGEWLISPSGRKKFKPLSTSDKSMNEVDRAHWTNRVVTYCEHFTGIEAHTLINEVRARGGGDPEHLSELAA